MISSLSDELLALHLLTCHRNAKDEKLATSLKKHVEALPEPEEQPSTVDSTKFDGIVNGRRSVMRPLKERTETSFKFTEELCQAVERSDLAVKGAQETQHMNEDWEDTLEQITTTLTLGCQAVRARAQFNSNLGDDGARVDLTKFNAAQQREIKDVFGLQVVDAGKDVNGIEQGLAHVR